MRRLRLRTTIAVCTAVLLAPAAPALADGPDYGGIPSSESMSTPVLADGELTDSDLKPLADKEVVLYAWPSNDASTDPQVGDTVKLQPISKAKTDKQGRFSLKLRDVADVAQQTDRTGVVNFEAIAGTPEGPVSFSFGRRVKSDKGGDYLGDPGTDEPKDKKGKHVVEHVKLHGQKSAETEATENEDRYAKTVDASQKGCSSTLVQQYAPVLAVVGQTNSQATGVSHDFVYTSGANSSLGVGTSVSGSAGTWKASGSVAKSNTAEVGFPAQGDYTAMRYKSYWKQGRYHVECLYAYGDGWYERDDYYEVRTTAFAGGSALEKVGYPGYKVENCVGFVNGSTFTKTTTKAYTFSTGLETKGIIGINLSASTGYSSQAKLSYRNGSGTSRHLCGYGDVPAGNTAFVNAIF